MMRTKEKFFASVIICTLLLATTIGCGSKQEQTSSPAENQTTQNQNASPSTTKSIKGKKILFIDSYAKDFAWSAGLQEGFNKELGPKEVEFKIFEMNTKTDPSEENKQNKAKEAKALIEEFKPDLVIVGDDNANKYVLMQYYKDSEIPFVSIGTNWDSKIYGLPYKNTAVQEEWALDKEIFDNLKKYAKGDKIGFISSDNETARKNASYAKTLFNAPITKEYYVKDFAEFKTKYKQLQNEVDMVFFDTTGGIKNWNNDEGKKFVLETTKVPSGSHYEWVTPYVLLGITTVPAEFTSWASNTAEKILTGESKPSDFEVGKNKAGTMYLNTEIAKKIGIQFDQSLLKNAKIVGQ